MLVLGEVRNYSCWVTCSYVIDNSGGVDQTVLGIKEQCSVKANLKRSQKSVGYTVAAAEN